MSTCVESKYCEKCGRSFLRPHGSANRYCSDHRDMQARVDENALRHAKVERAFNVWRVRIRVLGELRAALQRGEFGSARTAALADALTLLDSVHGS
jgi:hypothetical protein